jgi:hypothetical protein
MRPHVLFASAVVALAGLAVIGALALVTVREWCAIRRIVHAHRYQPSHQEMGAIRPGTGAKSMGAPGRWLLLSWLVAALVMLSVDGRLPVFLAWTTPSALLALGVGALVRQQRAPSFLDQPPFPYRYRVADDLGPADRGRDRRGRGRGNPHLGSDGTRAQAVIPPESSKAACSGRDPAESPPLTRRSRR